MVVQTARIQATVNGSVLTLGGVTIADMDFSPTNDLTAQQSIAVSLDRPILVDAGTAVTLVTGGQAANSNCVATVHRIVHDR